MRLPARREGCWPRMTTRFPFDPRQGGVRANNPDADNSVTLTEKLRASVLIETVTNVLNTAREERLPHAKASGIAEAARLLDSDDARAVPDDEMQHLLLLYAEALHSAGAMAP